jgi:hypothetical protein
LADDDSTEAKKKLHDHWVGMLFIQAADPRRFGAHIADLTNNYSRGKNEWPADLTKAYSMLVHYVAPPSGRGQNQQSQNQEQQPPVPSAVTDDASITSGLTFTQATTSTVAGADGAIHAHITCYECYYKGHYAANCLTKNVTVGTQHVQVVSAAEIVNESNDNADVEYGCTFTLVKSTLHQPVTIPKTWLLLDSQLTISIFCNQRLLDNIRPSETTLRIHTNGGTQESTRWLGMSKFLAPSGTTRP